MGYQHNYKVNQQTLCVACIESRSDRYDEKITDYGIGQEHADYLFEEQVNIWKETAIVWLEDT